ncbi:MAG: hypothetical protein ACOC9D_03685, partial [Thermodesulfobacteriota bacterium]
AEDRGQRTEDRRQRTVGRGRWAEDGGQRTVGRGLWAEDCGQRTVDGGRGLPRRRLRVFQPAFRDG